MTNRMLDFILPSARQTRMYAEKLLTGISADTFARKPAPGGTLLEMNHPAFTYGHLAIYPGLVLEMLNLTFEDVRAPENFYNLFKIGTPCHDDPEGTIYPRMGEIVSAFSRGYDTLLERASQASPEVLNDITPGERVARFPVKGNFLAHLMTSHVAQHMGQVSAWRRAMLMPPV